MIASNRVMKSAATLLALMLFSATAVAQIRVAVEDGSVNGSGAGLAAQLNDDTWFDFTATQVSAADIDTLAELLNYDVVILGGSGSDDADWTAAMALALRDWVQAGGGAILTGWGNFDMQSSNAVNDVLDEIFPTQNIASTNNFDNTGALMNILVPHPIVTGLTDFSFPSGCCSEINPLALELDDLELATMSGSPDTGTVVAVKPVSAGSTVYLGPVYMGSETSYSSQFPGLRQGDPDRLLEQAAAWAAEGGVAVDATPVPTMRGVGLVLMSLVLFLVGARRFARY